MGSPTSHLVVLTLTSLHDGGLVARTHGEHLEHTAGGPQKLLVAVVPHDLHKPLGSPIGQDDQLSGVGGGRERLSVRQKAWRGGGMKKLSL